MAQTDEAPGGGDGHRPGAQYEHRPDNRPSESTTAERGAAWERSGAPPLHDARRVLAALRGPIIIAGIDRQRLVTAHAVVLGAAGLRRRQRLVILMREQRARALPPLHRREIEALDRWAVPGGGSDA